MEKEPLISVIIPVYNVEKYLDECMDSVLHQTYTNLDVILVDDGSVDNSPEMCDEYAKKDARVQVIHKENGGLVSAWIDGVKSAKGDYVIFLDSDDWISITMVEDMVNQASGQEKEIICGNYIIEKEKKSIPVKQALEPGVYDRKKLEELVFPVLLGKENRSIHFSRCMKLISKELILDNIPYCDPALTMGEDVGIMLPAMWDAQRIVIMEEGYHYHYRSVDASMVHKYNPGMCEKVNLLYDTLKKTTERKIRDEKQRDFFLECLHKEYTYLFFFVLKNELRGPGKTCVNRIQKMLQRAKEERDLDRVSIEVNNKANQLLYYIMRNPGVLQISLGKLIIGIFDKLQ